MSSLKNRSSGFFMTEFLIYLVLSGLLAVFVMQYIFGTLLQLRATTQQTDRIAALHACLDTVAHDIEQAPSSVTQWHTLQKDELAWQQDNVKICWRVNKKKLQRRVQRFDAKKQRWKRPVTQVAFEGVMQLQCTPHYNEDRLHAVTVSISAQFKNKTYTCCQTVPLYRKVVS